MGIITSTLGKAISAKKRNYNIKTRLRPYLFSNSLAPSSGAASKVIDLLSEDNFEGISKEHKIL